MKYIIGFSAFALILMIFGLIDSTASASTQLFTQRVTNTGSRWNETISFPQADASRGELVAVVLQLSGNVKSAAQVELPLSNSSTEEQSFKINFDGAASVYAPSLSVEGLEPGVTLPSDQLLVSVQPQAPIEQVIKPTVGRALFKKRSAASHFESVGVDRQVVRLTEPNQLDDYIGNGLVSFPLQGGINANVTGDAHTDAYLRASTVTELSIEYVYQR